MELGNSYKAREIEGKMQRRATSKKRAAEAEKELEIDMDNKEATPVEVEEVFQSVLSKQTEQPKEQPEIPTQTVEINVPEKETENMTTQQMFRMMMEKMESTSKELKEDLSKKMGSDNQSLKEDLGNKIEKTKEELKKDNQSTK